MKNFLLFVLLLPAFGNSVFAVEKIEGIVNDRKTREPLPGVSVYTSDKKTGTATDAGGKFSLRVALPATLKITAIGYETVELSVNEKTKLPLVILLTEKQNALKEAVVKSESSRPNQPLPGVISMRPREMRFIASAAGEQDPIYALTLMPGIKKSANGGEGFFVRGGSPDQNLIMIDEAPVYNPNHLLGFFSVFNPEAVSEVKLYKGAFPANFGGRLSSVMNVQMKEGSFDKWGADAGFGLLATRILVNGPLNKKISISAGVRSSYINKVFAAAGNYLPYSFTDVNVKLCMRLSDKVKLTYTQFNGIDRLDYAPRKNNSAELDFGTILHNNVYNLKLSRTTTKSASNLYLIRTGFNYEVKAGFDNNVFALKSRIEDMQVKGDHTLSLTGKSWLRMGFEYTHHSFNPNQTSIFGAINELVKHYSGRRFSSDEAAVFALHDLQFTNRLRLNYGIRISSSFGKNFGYAAPEPRLNLQYILSPAWQLKISYNRMMQYMHLVSGSSAVMPTDLWFPVSKIVKPQRSNQLAMSIEYLMAEKGLVISVEPYFKTMQNLVEYREGTQILLNNNIENDLIQGKGRAYGIEWTVQKKNGKFNGWIGYTLSWTERRFNELNNGNWYYARYDRRHDFTLVGNYEIKKNLVFSTTFCLSSGMRVTPIIGKYAMPSGSMNEIITVPIYGNRNSLTLSPVHRLDMNLTYLASPWKKIKSEWSVGAYNIYNRTQAYKVSMHTEPNGQLSFKQVGLYGFIPSFSCTLKF